MLLVNNLPFWSDPHLRRVAAAAALFAFVIFLLSCPPAHIATFRSSAIVLKSLSSEYSVSALDVLQIGTILRGLGFGTHNHIEFNGV